MNQDKISNSEEINKLFEAADLDPKMSLSHGLILRANLFEIKALKDFLEQNGMYIVYSKTSPAKLFICTEREHEYEV